VKPEAWRNKIIASAKEGITVRPLQLGVGQRLTFDTRNDLHWGEPTSARERWSAAAYIASITLVITLVILAVVFDQFAATGVLLVAFLSFILTYLIAPASEWLRHTAVRSRRGRPLSRVLTTLVIYGIIAAILFPVWAFNGARIGAALARTRVLVPQHTARFVDQLHATEGWYETLGLPPTVKDSIGAITRRVTRSVEIEARALGAELAEIRGLVPWLSTVPVVAFLLLTRWHRFRRSTSRVLPTPHLRWRGDEFLRNLDSLLAAYTRAQTLSAVIVGSICWVGFAALGLPYPGTLGLAAGLLEMVPLAGPLVAAVVATAAAPDRVVGVLLFLAALRVLQDYVIYPRLIKRTLYLHPLAVVLALWIGAAVGGVVGVCLAVPFVGVIKATHRHWREYREIEALVAEADARSAAAAARREEATASVGQID
jgi:predicted PurR-regulated permease PerM